MALKGLSGKIAIVTGAASGIGAATCRRLVAEGCKVAAVDIDRDGLGRLSDALGAEVLPLPADVSIEADCDGYVDSAVERLGGVHLFVNNAALFGKRFPVAEMPTAEFDRVHAVNVRGAFMGLRAVLRQMKKQGVGGSIVNLASVGALRSQRFSCAYGSSKRAIIGLANSAAAENGEFGIRVNTVCPGPTDTPMLGPATGNPTNLSERFANLPLGRASDPSEIAALIAFLLSDDASFITAGVYTADGGMTH